MEDKGITSESGPLGRGSVDAVGALVAIGWKYLNSAIFKSAHDSATGCFEERPKSVKTSKIYPLKIFS